MTLPFPFHIKEIADDIGISLFRKLSTDKARDFISCSENELQNLVDKKKIDYIYISENNVQFFGHQLISYLLYNSTQNNQPTTPVTQERIIRAKEVEKMTGLSRTSIWRYEKKNKFPQRISLSEYSVGWRLSEIQCMTRPRLSTAFYKILGCFNVSELST